MGIHLKKPRGPKLNKSNKFKYVTNVKRYFDKMLIPLIKPRKAHVLTIGGLKCDIHLIIFGYSKMTNKLQFQNITFTRKIHLSSSRKS